LCSDDLTLFPLTTLFLFLVDQGVGVFSLENGIEKMAASISSSMSSSFNGVIITRLITLITLEQIIGCWNISTTLRRISQLLDNNLSPEVIPSIKNYHTQNVSYLRKKGKF
jgi:hypothetical protein